MLFAKDYFDLGGTVYIYDRVDKLPRDKENALAHFLAMTCRSWTFGRMTQEEKERCINAFLWAAEQGHIKGNFQARWDTMQAIYYAFLNALGCHDAFDWRAPEKQTGEAA